MHARTNTLAHYLQRRRNERAEEMVACNGFDAEFTATSCLSFAALTKLEFILVRIPSWGTRTYMPGRAGPRSTQI